MIASIGRFFTSLIFGFLALFKRALCFLNRKRRNSGAILPTHVQNADVEVPTQVLSDSFQFPVLPNEHVAQPLVSQAGDAMPPADGTFTEWDSWDKPALTQQDSDPRQLHSLSNSSKQPVDDPEPEPDYFSDLGLAPTIRKQKKVLVKSAVTLPHHETAERSNRLSFTPDLAAPLSAELEEWDESAGGAWEDEDLTLEAEQAMRQTRKAERERRLAEHQRRNQEKEQRKLSKDNIRLATKLS